MSLIHKKEKMAPMAKADPEDVEVDVTKKEGRKKMHAEFKAAKEPYLAPVDNREEFRKRILSMSLFPNLYNKEFLLKHM